MSKSKYKIGIVGTGFVARGLMYSLKYHTELELSAVLTRRDLRSLKDVPADKKIITQDINKLIADCDLIVECSGDTIHGTEVIENIFKSGLPVVTMNPELQITTGSILSQKGTLIEAEGDQPGTLAALDLEIRDMGFRPIVYGNIKRFLNLNPTPEDMQYWSNRQGITMDQVTAFTDASKVQIEQVLVANGLGAEVVKKGMLGFSCKDLDDGAQRLGEVADKIGKPISDYILSPTAPAGVFIVAKHDKEQKPYLEYLKLGTGPNYVIVRPHHLVHLEIPKTILKVLKGDKSYTFNNGQNPTAQVVAVAKRAIKANEEIKRGLGGFDIRGEAVKIVDCPDGIPVTLMYKAKFVKTVKEGQIVKFDDVELPGSRALEIWQETVAKVISDKESNDKVSGVQVNDHPSSHTPILNGFFKEPIGQIKSLLNNRFSNFYKVNR